MPRVAVIRTHGDHTTRRLLSRGRGRMPATRNEFAPVLCVRVVERETAPGTPAGVEPLREIGVSAAVSPPCGSRRPFSWTDRHGTRTRSLPFEVAKAAAQASSIGDEHDDKVAARRQRSRANDE